MNKKIIAGLVAVAVAFGGYAAYKSFYSAKDVAVNETQSENIAKFAKSETAVSALDLKELMEENDNVVVIGTTQGDELIPGSSQVWRPDYSASEGLDGFRNTAEEMAAFLGERGATADSTIVVYAQNAQHDATRLYWQIEMLGHEDVRVLDGGINAWIAEGFETTSTPVEVEAAEYVPANVNEDQLATLDMVIDAVNDDEWVIIDTRSEGEEDGSTTQSGAAGPGKIEGAIHIEWTEAVDAETGTIKDVEELQEIYGDLEGKNIISYCQSGVRSAFTTYILDEVLGFENIYNYDGSWIEYSDEYYNQGTDLPIENAK